VSTLGYFELRSVKLKTQKSKFERLFSLERGKRDVRTLNFDLSKMSLQVGLQLEKVFVAGRVSGNEQLGSNN